MKCPLCDSNANHFYSHRSREFYFCTHCFSVFLDPKNYLTATEEQKHYEQHNNDVHDLGYQEFVAPLVNAIKKDFSTQHQGLDFGSGTGPVITKMLRDVQYSIIEFDPFFANNPAVLKNKYNYIACCEVIEHFHYPYQEFKNLSALLLPGGKLYCKTDFFSETKNFDTWYYKNDPTHVFFYHPKTMAWICKNLGFSRFTIAGRMTVFEK